MIKSNFFYNKKILVTGGTGLIGRQLVDLLVQRGAKVTIVSLDKFKSKENIKFIKKDLRFLKNCLDVCKNKDIVFHLAGVKGSPLMTMKKPASFFVPTIMFSVNMMEAARRCGVKKYLFTSSIGVYAKSSIFYEDQVWKTFPSDNDKFAGWAKRICELQAEAYLIENKWKGISIVRPANVYGPYDNFDTDNAMVIPSLIKRALNSKKYLHVWGDGSQIRDFIFSKDVAEGMMLAVQKNIKYPINLGSGMGVRIREIAEIIANNVPNGPLKIKWDKSKPSGDNKRIMSVKKSNDIGFYPKINIKKGIIETINWYIKNGQKHDLKKYNSFKEKN